jgi:hypothetical protein
MCELLAKCAALVVMIHGFRVLARWAGPRWSGLALGLPSTTAIVLLVCGWEHGGAAATAMAESSLLGLVAAVALPLAYIQAVRLGCGLPVALIAAVGGYLAVATGLGSIPPLGVAPRLGIAGVALLCASCLARTPSVPPQGRRRPNPSPRAKIAFRCVIPALYVLVVALVDSLAGPGWTGLLGTFPSMSVVVLAVTHLEDGPQEASRIAAVLPAGNVSTLAFLAALRAFCPALGLAGGMIAGYTGAIATLALVAGAVDRMPFRPTRPAMHVLASWRSRGLPLGFVMHAGRAGIRSQAHVRWAQPSTGRPALHSLPRACFSPLVETLPG